MAQSFRKQLTEGKTLYGTLVTIPSPTVAEILAQSGFDWLFIDMEHSSISLQDAEGMIRASNNKAYSIIRCPSNDEAWIKRCLDTGADGIILPRINSKKEAEDAVRCAKYPPIGERSVGITRAHGYGMQFNEYMRRANEDVALILQCEHIDGVRELPDIARTEGVDAIFVGPYDLSASMNKTGKVDDPEVKDAINQISETCKKEEMPLGIFGTTPEAVKPYRQNGFTLLAVGVDSMMLAIQAKHLLEQLK
mgnify:FL=1